MNDWVNLFYSYLFVYLFKNLNVEESFMVCTIQIVSIELIDAFKNAMSLLRTLKSL